MDNNFEDGQEWPPKYTASEQECINYIEAMPDNEKEFETEKCHYDRKLWNYFQNCALAIAQLYRDNVNNQHNLWHSFQHASTNVACLYKECSEFQKKMHDGNHQNGYHKRTKELLTWAKKKKSYIRREELLAILSGRTYQPNHHSSFFHHRLSRTSRPSRNSDEIQRFLNTSSPSSKTNSRLIFNDSINESSNHVANSFNSTLDDDTNLEAFREALSMSGLRNPTNLLSNNSRRSPRSNNLEDLNEFMNQEFHRHVDSRKRTSSMDVCMDSPTHNKRTKFS